MAQASNINSDRETLNTGQNRAGLAAFDENARRTQEEEKSHMGPPGDPRAQEAIERAKKAGLL